MEHCENFSSEGSTTILSQVVPHSQGTLSQLPRTLPLPEKAEAGDAMALGSTHGVMLNPPDQLTEARKTADLSCITASQQDASQAAHFTVGVSKSDSHIIVSNALVTEDMPLVKEERLGFVTADMPLMKEERLVDKCKVRKRPRPESHNAEVNNGDGSSEKQAILRWKDNWVAELIRTKGRLHHSLTNAQKQRGDMWQIIRNELMKNCIGFDKDYEACRKKWRRIYKEYRDEKNLARSGIDRPQKCRFFALIDHYFGDKCTGAAPVSEDGIETPVAGELATPVHEPVPMLLNEAVEDKVNEMAAETDSKPSVNENPYMTERPELHHTLQKSYTIEKPLPFEKISSSSIHSRLAELVSIGREMLRVTRESEREKLAVLHSLKDTLSEIAKKI